MIKQLIKFFKKIPTSKFSLRLPNQKKVLVYDDMPVEDLKFVLNRDEYFLLKTRYDNVDKFYIHPLIILKTILKFRGNIWTAYLISLIEAVSPKIVITCTDNDLKFSAIAKKMKDKINFFAIQNGTRYDYKKFKDHYEKKIIKKNIFNNFYIPNFFCFGNFEIDFFKENSIIVDRFFPVGSLRLANLIKEINYNPNDEEKKKYKYDIILISDAIILNFDKKHNTIGYVDGQGKLINFVVKYVRKYNKRFLCSFKRLNSTKKNLDDEIELYRKYLNKDNFNFIINNSTLNFRKKKYLSYELMLESELTIAGYTTMLRENLSLGRKTLSLNLSENKIFDSPLYGFSKLNNCTFEEFENRVNKILDLTREQFISKLENKENYSMVFDKNLSAIEKIKRATNQYL